MQNTQTYRRTKYCNACECTPRVNKNGTQYSGTHVWLASLVLTQAPTRLRLGYEAIGAWLASYNSYIYIYRLIT